MAIEVQEQKATGSKQKYILARVFSPSHGSGWGSLFERFHGFSPLPSPSPTNLVEDVLGVLVAIAGFLTAIILSQIVVSVECYDWYKL
jgi:hypothetical protein